ncbi:lysine biosynthesis protein LysX [Micromonospora sp. RP3T]|uniref:lysine biosynthesis protein LysX n=1 Tax=Micromonospora sp. RP3T TaxID=2135446 RepID=UPI000D168481|nr:lysine biosynthesis protein LysX [Micromonospora sp. RP3T]PTA46532.1 lysine biosynthesis protein LysX [Micromonospora sp. RP3T]
MSDVDVVLVASRIRAEERALLEALRGRGVRHHVLDPRELIIEPTQSPIVDGVALIREISLTSARYTARALEATGSVTVNNSSVIEMCGDKALTALAFARHGVATPRTLVTLSEPAAVQACDEIGYPAVIKPVVGSWGRLVARVPDQETATNLLEHRSQLPGPQHRVTCVQDWVDKPGRDIRVLIVGDQPVAAMYRRSEHWRTNAALGAEPAPCRLTPDLAKLATDAARAVGSGVLGVDVVEDNDGRLMALEVNHGTEFRALQSVTDVDLADAIVEHVLGLVE